MTPEQLDQAIHEAEITENLDKLDKLAETYFQVVPNADLPFAVPVQFSAKVKGGAASLESGLGVELANRLSRARRRVAYNIKLRRGYNGPIIVAEGDSWFEYPVLLDDVLDHLMEPYAVYSLAGGGHLLADMRREQEYMEIIRAEKPDFFLLSGGGNDLLQNRQLTKYLRPYQNGMTAEQVLDSSKFDPFLATMLGTTREILQQVNAEFPNLIMLIHGYDYALPRPNGNWLGIPLEARNVPRALWADVVRIFIDKFNGQLKSFETLFPGKVFHIDCRNSVGNQVALWHDELHPKSEGYGRAAARFIERIEAVRLAQSIHQPAGSQEFATHFGATSEERRRLSIVQNAPQVCQPEQVNTVIQSRATVAKRIISAPDGHSSAEAIIASRPRMNRRDVPKPLPNDPQLKEWLEMLTDEDRRAYEDYLSIRQRDPELDPEIVQARLELTSSTDPFTMERIIGDSNLYQINFLSRGSKAARAIGRVHVISKFGTAMGSGTGFLVAPGLLMTNNHVLSSPDQCLKSYIVFDHEYDADNLLKPTTLFLLTPELFFTSKEFDFTIVSVAATSQTGLPIAEFGFLPLIELSGKAVPGEAVSIVQHPSGATKQLALRDSEILGRVRQFIYYDTDTNPGSSGAPVLNDDWLPVAIHHRAVPNFEKPFDYVANRGVRISSIMEHLSEQSRNHPQARVIYEQVTFAATGIEPSGIVPGSDTAAGFAATEAFREPFHEPISQPRPGYDANFLGIPVPLPMVLSQHQSIVAKLKNSAEMVLKYEHFSIVMHKDRRLPLFTASNVDASPARKRPDPNRPDSDYSRKGLAGIGRNDQEKWYEDTRLESRFQLPDRFYSQDQGAFDKGHLVRRDDVAWGDTYEELRRANGDTYFTTNCSPQVAKFNQSSKGGEWGKLENDVLREARTEKLCVFSGPVLDPSDRKFRGKDNDGVVLVPIPVKFWKLIVARSGDELQAFAFLLEQDLSNVNLEFEAGEEWSHRAISIPALESIVRFFRFPTAIRNADQHAEE